ncbi:MAG: MBL fold metallo-hydrolase [Acidobacteria bacterium]|nr:MBL fold metallo-hydrolase [Acidobacteriota bacterium]
MRITFLGTGTSSGVPVIACECATCRSDDARDRRWRTSVALALDDGTSVLVDASPDLRAQALAFGLTRVDTILLTHEHADHVLGLDDVRIYNFRQRRAIPCLGTARTLARVRGMFSYVFDPATPRGGGLPQLALSTVVGPFSIGGRTVVPIPLLHGSLPVLGFRIGAFAYLTDCNAIPDVSWPLLRGLDVVVLDALRRKPHATHFTLDEAVAAARRIGAARTYFTHMAHDLPHAATCDELPEGMTLAYDGLCLEADAGAGPSGPGAYGALDYDPLIERGRHSLS